MGIEEARTRAVDTAIAKIKAIVAAAPLERDHLTAILAEVKGLAVRREFWGNEYFAEPDAESRQARHLIHEEADHTFALYLNVMLPGRRIPPHDHTTWACVAGIEGEEHNLVYRRLDDRSRPGYAELELADLVVVGPDSGIALMPDDIHAVEIRGERPIRHLHMYGRALETLSARQTYDLDAKTAKPMPIGVQTRR